MYRLVHATLEIELRLGYLHVVAMGILSDVADVDEYNQLMERLMQQHHTRRALIDARGQTGEPPPEVRKAAWAWLLSGRGFEQVAYVVPEADNLKAARVNMTGLSHGFAVRSFTSVMEAHRWLTAGQRKATLSGEMRAVPRPSVPAPATDMDSSARKPHEAARDATDDEDEG